MLQQIMQLHRSRILKLPLLVLTRCGKSKRLVVNPNLVVLAVPNRLLLMQNQQMALRVLAGSANHGMVAFRIKEAIKAYAYG